MNLLPWPVIVLVLLGVIQLQAQVGEDSRYVRGHYKTVPVAVGALFDSGEQDGEVALQNAVERINADHSLLTRSNIETYVDRLGPANSVAAGSSACGMLKKGVAAIFGPQSHESACHVQSICDAFEIPHIETKWDYRIRKENYMINLHPHPMTLSRAYNDLVEAFGWESYFVIHDGDDGLFKVQDILKASIPPKRHAVVRQLPRGDDYRPLFREILHDDTIKNIVLDCASTKIATVLKQAQQVGLMTYQYNYILTTLDLHTVDLEDFRFAEVNITAFRLVDPDRPDVQTVLKAFLLGSSASSSGMNGGRQGSVYGGQFGVANGNRWTPLGGNEPPLHTYMIKTDTALVYDAVYLLARALDVLDSSNPINIRSLDCNGTETWPHGYSIINYMKMVQLQGLTGLIQFNTTGYRTDVHLDVIQLRDPTGLKKIGAWDSKFALKFNWTRLEVKKPREEMDAMDISNRTFVVTTMLNAPFTMLTLSQEQRTGNDRYEGYVVDMLQRLSRILGFKYIIEPVRDGSYGSRDRTTGRWDGMIRDILDGAADIAVADLSINKERQETVEFSMPFMNLGISILYVAPTTKPPSLFSFLSPFSRDVWIYMCLAFFGVSVILYVLARITPYEWTNPHPCITDPDELVNQFTSLNSFWFTIGSLMQQGSDVAPKKRAVLLLITVFVCFIEFVSRVSPYEWTLVYPYKHSKETGEAWAYVNDISFANALWCCMASILKQPSNVAPKAVSTRMIAGIWWFFTLIMVSSYTANLATFLIVQELDQTIKSLEDLAMQNKVKYGCVGTGSTVSFFRDSPFKLNKMIWDNIVKADKKHRVIVKNNKEGIRKVNEMKGGYAFFMESTVIEYTIERECSLAQVGGQLDNKGYGIALPKGSKYLQSFSSAILQLQETGVLDELKRKWWKEERKENICVHGSDDQVKPLKLANVGGVFVVVAIGCSFAIIMALLEFFWNSREMAGGERASYWQDVRAELKFALLCRGNTKPVKKKSSLRSVDIGTGSSHGMGSNPYLDLPMEAYGFPKLPATPMNGRLGGEGYT